MKVALGLLRVALWSLAVSTAETPWGPTTLFTRCRSDSRSAAEATELPALVLGRHSSACPHSACPKGFCVFIIIHPSTQDQLHHLRRPVQNENRGPSSKCRGKGVKRTKIWSSFLSSVVSLASCQGVFYLSCKVMLPCVCVCWGGRGLSG